MVSAASAWKRAGAAGLAKDHERAVASLPLPDVRDQAGVAEARRAIDGAIERMRRAAEHLVARAESVRTAAAELEGARGRLDERTKERDRARDVATDAETGLQSARRALVAELRAWVASLEVLEEVDVEDVAERIRAWSGDRNGPDAPPVSEAAARAESAARERLTRALAELDARIRTVDDERTEVLAERESAAAGVHRPPPTPHTRDAWRGRVGPAHPCGN